MEQNIIYNENCLEGTRKHIASESVDLLMWDASTDFNRTNVKNQNKTDNESFLPGYFEPAEDLQFIDSLAKEAFRILKPTGALYVFMGGERTTHICAAARKINFYEMKPINIKFFLGWSARAVKYSPPYSISFFTKTAKQRDTFNADCSTERLLKFNGKALHRNNGGSIWYIKEQATLNKAKLFSKPSEVILKKIIQYSSKPGELICDFFPRNSATAVLSKRLMRNYIGFEPECKINNRLNVQFNNIKARSQLSKEDLEIEKTKGLQEELFG